MEFVNYHCHRQYSNAVTIDCAISHEDYIRRIKELGHETLTVIEHGYTGGMTSILEAYSLCKKNNIKMLIGAECYFVKDRKVSDDSNWHIVIIALNHSALRQLNLAISLANETGFYKKARLDYELISKLTPENFIVTSACIGGVANDTEIIEFLKNHFKENFYLEIQSHNHIAQINFNKHILSLSEQYDIELIHGCDTHWITEDDKFKRKILLSGKGMNYGDEDSFENDYPSYDEILERYRVQGVVSEEQAKSALENTMIIKEKTEEFAFNDNIKMPTLYPNETHEQKMKRLENILNQEYKRQYGHLSGSERKRYLEAIRYETSIIRNTCMEDYFLLNYYIIKRAKELGMILTQTGRGSAVSFLNNKLLGFTEVDRLQEKVQLYPTRFMSESRILQTRSLPDIDFNMVEQTQAVQATKELLGEHSCYVMLSYGTMKEKATIKNVCRSLGIDADEANLITKDIEGSRNNSKYDEVFKITDMMGNVIDSVSPNPCGYLILNDDIREEIGIIRVNGVLCAMIDKHTADKWKYLKNDFLMVSVYDIISKVYAEIGEPIDDIKSLRAKTDGNEKVWKIYEQGLTATLNQTATDSSRPQVMQYKPKNVEELTAFVAAIRPSFASMKDYLLNRKPFSYNIPEFDKLLESSMHFVLFQENIMATLVYVGFPEDETYGLIKAISKKDHNLISGIKDRFINGFIEKTGSEENAYRVWQIIEDASAYGFNSSHALSVAYDSLYGAYLKSHYPLQYYAVTLNLYENDQDITALLTSELPYFNIELSDIKFGFSKSKYTYDKETMTIYKGMKSIKYLNEKVSDELYELSKNNYNDPIELFIDIVEKTSCNARQIKILIMLNFFSEFGEGKYLLNLFELINKRYDKKHKDKTKQARLEEIRNTEIVKEEFKPSEIIAAQKEYLGYATYKDEKYNPLVGVITDISNQYATRWMEIYFVKNGKTRQFKIKYSIIQELELKTGDMIYIKDFEKRPRKKLVNGKWVNGDVQDFHITNIVRV